MKKKYFIFLFYTFFGLYLFFIGLNFVQSSTEEQTIDEYNIFGMLDINDIKTITKTETGCTQDEEKSSVLNKKDKKNIITILKTIKAERLENDFGGIYGGRVFLTLEYTDGRTDCIEMTGSLTEPDIIYNNTTYKIQPNSMDTCISFRDSYLNI